MGNLSVTETLNKFGSDFINCSITVNTEIIEHPCPKCGADVLCAHADMGTTDFVDTYHHICMNPECTHIEKKDFWGISMGCREVDGPAVCPFCHRRV